MWPVKLSVSTVAIALVGVLAVAKPAGAFVYWTNFANGGGTKIGRANVDGSGGIQDFISGAKDPIGLAVDAGHIYWANEGTNSIGRANLDGSSPEPNFILGAHDPYGIAVDGRHIYWANDGSDTIGRADLDGTGADQSFITGASDPEGVAVDGGNIYWANGFGQTIGRASLDGSDVDQAFINPVDPHSLTGVAVDAEHVYWTNDVQGSIGRANLDGTGVQNDFIADAGTPILIAVDAEHLYWADATADHISTAQLDGGDVVSNFANASDPYGVAVDVRAHQTATSVICTPATLMVASSASCKTTVTDIDASAQTPVGTITFAATRAGSFAPPSGCLLGALSSSKSTCQMSFRAGAIGPTVISATFGGDRVHTASTGTTSLSVTGRLPPPVVASRPTISSLRETNARFAAARASTPLDARTARTRAPRGTVFSFQLDQPATVKIAIQTRVRGRRAGRGCVRPSRKLRQKARCTRVVTIATLTRAGHLGSNRVPFTGRLRERALTSGHYQARFTAIDAIGASRPRTLTFTVVR